MGVVGGRVVTTVSRYGHDGRASCYGVPGRRKGGTLDVYPGNTGGFWGFASTIVGLLYPLSIVLYVLPHALKEPVNVPESPRLHPNRQPGVVSPSHSYQKLDRYQCRPCAEPVPSNPSSIA